MALSTYELVNKIYGLKNDWTKANASGDSAAMNKASQGAKTYYDQLRASGQGSLADELERANASQAGDILKRQKAAGKSAIRPRFYSLGKQYGLSQSDIDKMIGYNEKTGEVSFNGKNLGQPVVEIDGVSYWDDDFLTQTFQNGMKELGMTPSEDTMYKTGVYQVQQDLQDNRDVIKGNLDTINKNSENLYGKYDKLEDYQYNTNPYETDWGKSIMDKYKWQGVQASDNAAASGASSNGGNIDSYAAANAARQQAVFTNMGQQAVQSDFTNRINNIRGMLSDLGVAMNNQQNALLNHTSQLENNVNQQMQSNQQIYDNQQDRLDRENQRLETIANVTGYVPSQWANATNMFLDENGNLKEGYDAIDFKNIINNSSDPQMVSDARVARAKKLFDNYAAYGQWDDGDYAAAAPLKTQAAREAEEALRLQGEQIKSDERQNQDNNRTALEMANVESDTSKATANINADARKYEADSAYKTQLSKNQTELLLAQYSKGGELEEPPLDYEKAMELYDNDNRSDAVLYTLYYYGDNSRVQADGEAILAAKDTVESVKAGLETPSESKGNMLYFPLQELIRNRNAWNRTLVNGKSDVDQMIKDYAQQVASAEGSSVEEVLRREGAGDLA